MENDSINESLKHFLDAIAESKDKLNKFVTQQTDLMKKKRQMINNLKTDMTRNERNLKDEQRLVMENIKRIKNQNENISVQNKKQQIEIKKLNNDIQTIPKNFEDYQVKIRLLETTANHIKGEKEKADEFYSSYQTDLSLYEALYGIKISISNGKTKFVFLPQSYEVELDCIQNNFVLSNSTLPSSIATTILVDEFNNSRDLFSFLNSIRQQI
ncbi:hypothetical protein TVAG_498460 [Trichomonas vaginalis G3]|uniref:Kinetochore protein SPC25 n=1 Tax=Trichomonas vaginalis (strain ATCC PRA-98 / G3) TaxID=412133 RepID=A2E834_TRIV3|nr:hypothetical protein TVAGG3_0973920 [Trichomonas vaginalis G3]EAY11152.1 hypothetical protein TVAG_498460 [Trichomonas vaginalis G3]KAI5488782.1 hypothetical protein TVAGG3_0973920 [Trichomonas vaginalis G3]|eukprot:XP_001323375.1 hypothetical protein [Trichomonas vaginalis G3]